jgi:hypothetical protein
LLSKTAPVVRESMTAHLPTSSLLFTRLNKISPSSNPYI